MGYHRLLAKQFLKVQALPGDYFGRIKVKLSASIDFQWKFSINLFSFALNPLTLENN